MEVVLTKQFVKLQLPARQKFTNKVPFFKSNTFQTTTPQWVWPVMCDFIEQKLICLCFFNCQRGHFHKTNNCTRRGKDWKQEQALDCRERNEDKILFYLSNMVAVFGAAYFNVRTISQFQIL